MNDGSESRDLQVRKARRLEYLTLAWNACEAGVAIGSGVLAGSAALLGFGVDSLVESTSGTILLWRFGGDPRKGDREQRALRLVGVSFLLLASWVTWEAAGTLLGGETPGESLVGIVLAVASLVVMPLLARSKRKVARKLQSHALEADSRQTDLCAYLSGILLAGLGLNALFGWWWADPVAALGMVPIIAHEGFEALRGETCAHCHVHASGDIRLTVSRPESGCECREVD